MKKMMFNDRFGLTEAVLEKRKTVTRRMITCPRKAKGVEVFGCYVCSNKDGVITEIAPYDADERTIDGGAIMPPYNVGEIVAVAQSYNTIYEQAGVSNEHDGYHPAWKNKMFIKADIMPHQIRILNVRAEKLQDITDEDCLREGIIKYTKDKTVYKYDLDDGFEMFLWRDMKRTPQEAFAAMIDKISGKGTWNSNPFVWRIEFELVK